MKRVEEMSLPPSKRYRHVYSAKDEEILVNIMIACPPENRYELDELEEVRNSIVEIAMRSKSYDHYDSLASHHMYGYRASLLPTPVLPRFVPLWRKIDSPVPVHCITPIDDDFEACKKIDQIIGSDRDADFFDGSALEARDGILFNSGEVLVIPEFEELFDVPDVSVYKIMELSDLESELAYELDREDHDEVEQLQMVRNDLIYYRRVLNFTFEEELVYREEFRLFEISVADEIVDKIIDSSQDIIDYVVSCLPNCSKVSKRYRFLIPNRAFYVQDKWNFLVRKTECIHLRHNCELCQNMMNIGIQFRMIPKVRDKFLQWSGYPFREVQLALLSHLAPFRLARYTTVDKSVSFIGLDFPTTIEMMRNYLREGKFDGWTTGHLRHWFLLFVTAITHAHCPLDLYIEELGNLIFERHFESIPYALDGTFAMSFSPIAEIMKRRAVNIPLIPTGNDHEYSYRQVRSGTLVEFKVKVFGSRIVAISADVPLSYCCQRGTNSCSLYWGAERRETKFSLFFHVQDQRWGVGEALNFNFDFSRFDGDRPGSIMYLFEPVHSRVRRFRTLCLHGWKITGRDLYYAPRNFPVMDELDYSEKI